MTRKHLLLLCGFLVWVMGSTEAHSRDYYVSPRGDDSGPGTRAEPWRSISRVNDTTFGPGDRVCFQGGGTFVGTIQLDREDSGTVDRKLTVTSYGNGRAVIDGANGSGLRANGCNHVVVKNLTFVGSGRKNGNTQDGVWILDARGLQIEGIEVHGFRGSGVQADGVSQARITGVNAHDNGAAGISVGYQKRSQDVHFSWCIAANNPGDPSNLTNHSGNGIVVANVQNGIIEYCTATRNGWDMPRKGNGPVGIWAWNSDHVIIQHCRSHDNKSPGDDGGGFDFDGGTTNSILQYNLSYNNDGPGYFLCQFPGAPDFKNNIIRYNISQNDGAKNNRRSGIDVYSASPNASSCQVYNNTIYTRHGAAVGFGGLPMPDVVFRNNLFICSGDVVAGETQRGRFENNTYWSADGRSLSFDGHPTLAAWAEATGQEKIDGRTVGRVIDPKLVGPIGDAVGWALAHADSLGAGTQEQHGLKPILQEYWLTPDSPCLGAGIVIQDNGGRDFWGNRVPESARPAVGACEKPYTGKGTK